ncbi:MULTISPECIES: hypothetical protein [Protofrankia]|uniref:Uncharacterized protein n=1 Tax=Protofrankia coriariae TaxID=1562887 RepID=A0ABR5F5B0_9ACTN|nr:MULTISPECIES: hypothetical protein [Protofrankia]KLL11842.1 hypothetical protein FrCorBMG51_08425 [Protofrankia coriariae]ONH34276.1 hypothetical protein BL254_17310 [Protofrankia sp. BMG5.30]
MHSKTPDATLPFVDGIRALDEVDLVPDGPLRAEAYQHMSGEAYITLALYGADEWIARDGKTLAYQIDVETARTLIIRLAGLISTAEAAVAERSDDVLQHPDYAGLREITTQHADGRRPEDMTVRDWADLACGLEALLLSQRPHSHA